MHRRLPTGSDGSGHSPGCSQLDRASGRWFQAFSNGQGFDYASGQWSPGWEWMIADFNGDSRDDVLLYDPAAGEWWECLAGAPGQFTYANGTWALAAR